jgi:4-alpha-glucanotransferase
MSSILPAAASPSSNPVLARRRGGVLLHVSSLGAGLGRGGRAFIDWLASAGFTVWQILPLGPTGRDGSPYWVRSDSAGNAALIDPEEPAPVNSNEFQAFLEESRDWLEDYAAFEVLSMLNHGTPWWTWSAEHRDRQIAAMERLRREQSQDLRVIREQQFTFAWQWRRLHEYARSRGVYLFGDVPFYVAPDSAEAWANREQFLLDAAGHPTAVAGVPPDYFSQFGQLWGNPLYDWDVMLKDGFRFWRSRIRHQLRRVDLLRIDHFRALAAHWAVPAGASDARGGSWQPTPGRELLQLLKTEMGDLPLVAEDLGLITWDVEALRRDFGLAGMRVMQFGFDGTGDNLHLPHMYERSSVVYTGTHDNDTTVGWYASLDADTRGRVDYFLRAGPGQMPQAMIHALSASVAQLAIVPMQDVLGLGSEARLNTPGTVIGNWSWRLPENSLTPDLAQRFALLNRVFGRA